MSYWYYEADDGRNLYWSDKELTEEEQRRAHVHFTYMESRLYGRLNNGRKRPYLVRKVPLPEPKLIPEIFRDPNNPRIQLLRFIEVYDEEERTTGD